MFPTVALSTVFSNRNVKLSMLTKSLITALGDRRIVKGAGRPNKADVPVVILIKALRAVVEEIEAAETQLEAAEAERAAAEVSEV